MEFLKRNFRLPDCWDHDQMEDDDNKLSVFYQIERYLDDKMSIVQPSTLGNPRSVVYTIKLFVPESNLFPPSKVLNGDRIKFKVQFCHLRGPILSMS